VIDADGNPHVFSGKPGPNVTMRLTDRSLYRKLVFNPELHAGEAYMDGHCHVNRKWPQRTASMPFQATALAISHTLKASIRNCLNVGLPSK
jgi:hypothetical protein